MDIKRFTFLVHVRTAFSFFQSLRMVSTCLQQDSALEYCAGMLLHSSTGWIHTPCSTSCELRRLHRLDLSRPVQKVVQPHVEINILNDVIPYKRGYSTGVLSHREGREGKEREWWSQFGSDLSQNGFINLHTHPNDNAHPVPAKHDAYIWYILYILYMLYIICII